MADHFNDDTNGNDKGSTTHVLEFEMNLIPTSHHTNQKRSNCKQTKTNSYSQPPKKKTFDFLSR